MSVLWLLLILGGAVTIVTNAWRHGDLDLTGKEANLLGVYLRAAAVGVAVALVCRVNVIDIARGSGIGWTVPLWDARAGAAEQAAAIFEQIGGIVVTGIILALAGKFWNEVFDIIHEFKRWLRGHANAMKPEPRGSSTATRTVRRSRGGRRRGGDRDRDRGDRGGGGGGGNDQRGGQ